RRCSAATARSLPRWCSLAETAVPILPARDLRETLAFYERLGFENRGADPEAWDYLIIGRGGAELHFFPKPDVDPLTTDFSCYIRVPDAGALHREWEAVGVPADAATRATGRSPSPGPAGPGPAEGKRARATSEVARRRPKARVSVREVPVPL